VIRGGKKRPDKHTPRFITFISSTTLNYRYIKLRRRLEFFFLPSFCHLEEGVGKRMVVKINDAIILFGEREREKKILLQEHCTLAECKQ